MDANHGAHALLSVRAKPGSKTEGVSFEADTIAVRVRARPVEGAANEAIIRVLAEALAVPRSHVAIERGAQGRQKRVRIEGLSSAEVFDRIRERG